MSFRRAMHEIAELELKAKDLERAAKGKDYEIARLSHASPLGEGEKEVAAVIEALNAGKAVAETLASFIDRHQALETGMNVSKICSPDSYHGLVGALAGVLARETDEATVVECLRLARGLLRESKHSCSSLVDSAFPLFLSRINRKQSFAIRDGAMRCFHLSIAQNPELRNRLIEDEQAVDRLTIAVEEIATMIRSQDECGNGESARLIVTMKQLFEGSQGQEDRLIALLLLKSKFVSAAVERMTKAFLEIADLAALSLKETDYPVLSTSYEGIARGTLLLDGFRFMYVVAVFADQEMLQAMLRNDGVPTLAGQDLENCDLMNPNLGVGDRYVFLQTHVLLAKVPIGAPKKDIDNFDAIKIAVCNILMFADKAPGFVAYLFRRKVAHALFDLIDRETTRVKAQEKKEEDLLPILIAIKTLVDNSDDFKEQFQDMFFERILPEIDPADYNTEDEFKAASEQRHFAGRSIPDTVFGKVVSLLTSFDDHVKRFAGELLYFLCDDDPTKVSQLVGFGHAAHILAIKGGMLGNIGVT